MMRNTLIGIVIGVVLGVMVGATVVAPGLQDARQVPSASAVPGSETLPLDGEQSAPSTISAKALATRPSRAIANAGSVTRLRIISLFPPKLPVLGEMAQRLERALVGASGGTLNAQIFAPGTLVPAADTFDAVASGTVEAAFSAPGQWNPDEPTLQLFTAIPFGPDVNELLAWYYHGGGRGLFEAQFQRVGVHGVLCGAIPPEGAGWYLEPVRQPEDFQGLTIRAYGLGAEVLRKMGAKVVDLDVGGILAGFESRQLDGAEYSLPAVDADMGFQRFARNYYFPGWLQPVSLFALAINQQVWNDMSPGAKDAVNRACGDNVRFALTRADALQFDALKTLGLAGVNVRRWPDPVLDALEEAWTRTRRELAAKDPEFAKVWGALQQFSRDYSIWRDLSRP